MKRNKKEEVKDEILTRKELTAQQWIPLADIKESLVYKKDSTLLAALRVSPKNLELLSDKEKKRIVNALAEVLNGEKEPIQIFCIGRPVDLNYYLEWLQEQAHQQMDFNKKLLLKGFIQQASQVARSGEVIERRFYMIVTKEAGVKAEDEIKLRVKELQDKLLKAELSSVICREDEYMDLFSLFANPIQAAYEKTGYEYDISTVLS